MDALLHAALFVLIIALYSIWIPRWAAEEQGRKTDRREAAAHPAPRAVPPAAECAWCGEPLDLEPFRDETFRPLWCGPECFRSDAGEL